MEHFSCLTQTNKYHWQSKIEINKKSVRNVQRKQTRHSGTPLTIQMRLQFPYTIPTWNEISQQLCTGHGEAFIIELDSLELQKRHLPSLSFESFWLVVTFKSRNHLFRVRFPMNTRWISNDSRWWLIKYNFCAKFVAGKLNFRTPKHVSGFFEDMKL